jgi:hypothetical protein
MGIIAISCGYVSYKYVIAKIENSYYYKAIVDVDV